MEGLQLQLDSRSSAVAVDELMQRRNAQLPGIQSHESATVLVAAEKPTVEAGMSQVGKRMSEGRKLPIEDGDDPGVNGIEDQIAHAKVAVDDSDTFILGYVDGEPCDELLDLGQFVHA